MAVTVTGLAVAPIRHEHAELNLDGDAEHAPNVVSPVDQRNREKSYSLRYVGIFTAHFWAARFWGACCTTVVVVDEVTERVSVFTVILVAVLTVVEVIVLDLGTH